MKNNKPKLELDVNMPCKIKLLQDKPATGNSQYGTWHLYNVLSGGQEYSFFAPDQVVQFINENQLSKNSEIVITKQIVKNGNKKVTNYVTTFPQLGNSQSNGTVINNGINDHSSPEFAKMLQSMDEALQIKNRLGSEVDASKIGITLFITRMKAIG